MKKFAILLFALFSISTFGSEPEIKIPDGYELQILDITKGQIAKPKGWFYKFFNDDKSLVWTISKEDLSKGSYKTGMRIQFSPAISKFTQKSPKELISSLIERKTTTVKVDRLRQEEDAGHFKRICLETTEPSISSGDNFKILYTFFWSDEKNAIAITTFGAPESEWDSIQPTIATMSELILIGKEFWSKK